MNWSSKTWKTEKCMLIFLSKSGGRAFSPLPLPSSYGPGLKSSCSGPGANTSSTKVNAFSRLMGPKRKTQNRNKIGLITIGWSPFWKYLQVNLCQKVLFLHQLTHIMMTDCSFNFKFNTWKFQATTWGEHVLYRNCFWHSEQFLYTTCSPNVLQKEDLLTKIYL